MPDSGSRGGGQGWTWRKAVEGNTSSFHSSAETLPQSPDSVVCVVRSAAYVHHRSGQTPRPTLRTDIVMCMVFAWGMRLGSYLVRRIWKDGHDKRFDGVKTDPVMFWVYWTLQVPASPPVPNTPAVGHPHAHVWASPPVPSTPRHVSTFAPAFPAT